MGEKLGHPTDRMQAIVAARSLIDLIQAAQLPQLKELMIAGSVRRDKEVVSDVDLVIVTHGLEDLTAWNGLAEPIHWTPKGGSVDDFMGVRIELYLAPQNCAGPTMQFVTGPGDLNKHLRTAAQQRGWKMSQYGIINTVTGERVDTPSQEWRKTEREQFELLGFPYLTPQQRSDWRTHFGMA